MQSQMLALRLLSLQANQLFKHTSLLTLAGERAARVLLTTRTISPDSRLREKCVHKELS